MAHTPTESELRAAAKALAELVSKLLRLIAAGVWL